MDYYNRDQVVHKSLEVEVGESTSVGLSVAHIYVYWKKWYSSENKQRGREHDFY